VSAIDPAAELQRGTDLIVELELAPASGGLRLDGNVARLGPSPWREGARALAHVHIDLLIDPELRAYLPEGGLTPPRKAGPLRARGAPVGDVALLALDAGDLDGDGRAEVAGATAEELYVWRWDASAARFVELRRARFAGPPAMPRPRDDVAAVSIDRGEVRARSSRYAEGLALKLGPGPAAIAPASFPLPGLGGCALDPGADWFSAATCMPPTALPPRFWTAAALRGGSKPAHAAVDPERTLWLWLGPGEPRPQTLRPSGAQLALGALERGEVLVTGDAADPGAPDAIVVRALTPGAPLIGRVEHLPGNVAALAIGDLDGDGRGEIVAAIRAPHSTELWVAY
jgi:hypothetical protein